MINDHNLLALGARISLRGTARQVLDVLDRMTGHEILPFEDSP